MDYEIGKIYSGKEVGKIGKHVFSSCPKCGKPRLIRLSATGRLCRSCAAIKLHKDNPRIGRKENHYNWKGGILRNGQGYILQYVKKTSKYYPMANCARGKESRFGAYCLQHRLVMAKSLGRCLETNELVHHINGDKSDNRIENLRIVDRKNHGTQYQDGFRDGFVEAMKLNQKKWNGEDWVKEK